MSRQTATQRDDKVLSVAKGIVERFRERGNVLPRQVNPQDRNTPAKVQEAKASLIGHTTSHRTN